MRFRSGIGAGASQARLASLLEQRLQPGVDKAAIDQRIWDLFGERWAVMFTDLSGFSRHVAEFGIPHFLQVIYESERLFVPIIDTHDGILLKVEGDSMLVLFRNPASAVSAALDMQRCLPDYNASLPPEEHVLLCVGLGYGDVLCIGDDDVFGAQVNAASKLGEDTAGPWEILVTDALRDIALTVDGVQGAIALDAVLPGATAAYSLDYARH